MKTAIIIHGMPSKEEYFDSTGISPSNNHWFAWLQKQLLVKNILTQTPEMPTPYEPRYEEWCSIMDQFKIDENTMLVGHSLGAGFLVRWLSEKDIHVGRVVLVAPWLDPNRELKNGFCDFSINHEIAKKTESLTVFISDDDDQEELTSVDILKSEVENLKVVEFTGKGHFILPHMGTEEFPELRNFLLQ